MSLLKRSLLKYSKSLFLLFVAVCGNTICLSELPFFYKKIVDEAVVESDFELVIRYAVYMAIMAVCAAVFGILMSRLSSYISIGVGKDIRRQIFIKVQNFSKTEMESFSTSSLIVRTNNDVAMIQYFLTAAMGLALSAPLCFIVSVICAFKLSPTLAMVMFPCLIIVAALVIVVGRKADVISVALQKEMDKMNLLLREKLTGVRVIRAFGRDEYETQKFKEANDKYTELNIRQLRLTNLLMPIYICILGMTIVTMLLIAFFQLRTGHTSIQTGNVLACIQYMITILLQIVFVSVIMMLMPKALTSARRVEEVLNTDILIKETDNSTDAFKQKGFLEFKNVSFTYRGSSRAAIKNLSFISEPGEITAIIGGTGSGKSTAVNLIPRLYDVTEGQVLVDGVDVRNYKLDVLRNKIGFVPQKSILFSGTVDSNMKFGKENASDVEVAQAIRNAQAEDFVLGKKEGYEEKVSQGGMNFSGGQKQRLCIARALIRKPEIYVFDDSFSALDFKTDKKLRKKLKKETGDATVILVTQRVGTAMDADRIIVLENGCVEGIGRHEELIRNCRVYQEITASQLGKDAVK